jgi:hypothetical protein
MALGEIAAREHPALARRVDFNLPNEGERTLSGAADNRRRGFPDRPGPSAYSSGVMPFWMANLTSVAKSWMSSFSIIRAR